MIRILLFILVTSGLSSLNAKEPPCKEIIKKLFEGNPRKNFEEAVEYLKMAGLITSKDARSLLEASATMNEGLFDIENAPRFFKKAPSDVTVDEALLLVEVSRARMKIDGFKSANPFLLHPWLRWSLRRLKQGAKITFGAVVLTGLFASASGLGAPVWDFVTARTRQLAFWATAPSSSPLSPIENDLNDVYRTTNGTFSGTAQIAGSRVTYFESALMNATTSLATQRDPEWRRIVLNELNRVVQRYSDILTMPEGAHAREMLSYIQTEFDPDKEILGSNSEPDKN